MTCLELLEQGWGHRRRGGGDQDAVVGGKLGPTIVAVAVPGLYVRIAQAGEPGGGLSGQLGNDLHRTDLADHAGKDGRLVPGAGADLQHTAVRAASEEVRHQGDDEGLGDGLAVADGQRAVGVGITLPMARDEIVARDLCHGRHYPLVETVTSDH